MKPKKTNHSQGELFNPRLSSLLNPSHPLLLLSGIIDWDQLREDLSSYFDEKNGAPAKPIQLIAGIFMLQHMSGISDEQCAKVWVENPYWQSFCGYDYLQWKFPIDPSSLCRWRQRLGKKGMQKILAETIRSALGVGFVKEADLKSVSVDTTVMPKNIAYPTDARLYYKSIQSLVRKAKHFGIVLRQTYKYLSKKALFRSGMYSRCRKMKQSKREVKRLKTYLGRVLRDVKRRVQEDKQLKRSFFYSGG